MPVSGLANLHLIIYSLVQLSTGSLSRILYDLFGHQELLLFPFQRCDSNKRKTVFFHCYMDSAAIAEL